MMWPERMSGFAIALCRILCGALVIGLASLTHPAASIFASARADEISVTQWGASLYGVPFAVAMKDGLFTKAGIEITGIIGSGGGGTTVRNILASPTPYGEVATAAALAAAQQGLDLVVVNTGTRSVAESSLVTLPDSDVRSLSDLVGRKVAITSPRSVSEMILLMEMQHDQVDAGKVTRVAAGGYTQGLTMLDQGAVAAAVLIEPLSILRQDRYRTVVAAKDELAPMTTSLGITTHSFAAAHPEKLRAILAGRRAAVQAIYADPPRASAILAEAFHMDLPLATTALNHMVAVHMWSEGGFDPTELDRVVAGLRLIGEIKGEPDWSKLIDAGFLPKDLRKTAP
jgi:NitT/TauT family transport system substrate-binding protein